MDVSGGQWPGDDGLFEQAAEHQSAAEEARRLKRKVYSSRQVGRIDRALVRAEQPALEEAGDAVGCGAPRGRAQPVILARAGPGQAWTAIVGPVADAFTHPGFAVFTDLVDGWVLTPGRRTITRVIDVIDAEGRRAHDAYHRLICDGAWSMN